MTTTVREKRDRQIAQHFGPIATQRSANVCKTIGDFLPCAGTVVVKQEEPEKVTKGGVVIPERYAEPQRFGTVVAVPEECAEYRLGDVVLFRSEGVPIILDDVEYIVLQFRGAIDDDILGQFVRD